MPSILTSRHAAHPDSGRVHAVPSEITPQAVYAGRRQWLREAALLGGGVLTLGAALDRGAGAERACGIGHGDAARQTGGLAGGAQAACRGPWPWTSCTS